MGKRRSPKPNPPGRDRLEEPLHWFEQGDYTRARAAFSEVVKDPSASEAEIETAKALTSATRVDPMTALTGLACLVLFAVAATLTAFIQP